MAEVNWLNKLTILKKLKNSTEETSNDYPLAVDFDHVYYETEETEIVNNETITHTYWWTLKDFFDKIQNFFKQRMFMKYTGSNIDTNSTIMEWYHVTGKRIDSRIDTI